MGLIRSGRGGRGPRSRGKGLIGCGGACIGAGALAAAFRAGGYGDHGQGGKSDAQPELFAGIGKERPQGRNEEPFSPRARSHGYFPLARPLAGLPADSVGDAPLWASVMVA